MFYGNYDYDRNRYGLNSYGQHDYGQNSYNPHYSLNHYGPDYQNFDRIKQLDTTRHQQAIWLMDDPLSKTKDL